ncbi:macrosialin [Elgaria multicarinata webbii]|uniref:macrosialin n=1 Tax=Elgaria multicarinata webbii TaxID=159646 RepID=UPI002FCD5DE3
MGPPKRKPWVAPLWLAGWCLLAVVCTSAQDEMSQLNTKKPVALGSPQCSGNKLSGALCPSRNKSVASFTKAATAAPTHPPTSTHHHITNRIATHHTFQATALPKRHTTAHHKKPTTPHHQPTTTQHTTALPKRHTTAHHEKPTTALPKRHTTAHHEKPTTALPKKHTTAHHEKPTTALPKRHTTAHHEKPTTALPKRHTTAHHEKPTTALPKKHTTTHHKKHTTPLHQPTTTQHTTALPKKHTTAHHKKHTTTHHGKHTTAHPTTAHHKKHTTTHHRPTTSAHPTTAHHKKHTTAHPTTTTSTHPTTHKTHTTSHHRPTTSIHHTTSHHKNHTTSHPTTAHHFTNHTTAPATLTTSHHHTVVPPPTQTPGVPVGDYVVKNGSAVCLRAQAGLQLQVRYTSRAKQQLWGVFAVPPNSTITSGTCSTKTASLNLRFPGGFLFFTFQKNETQNTFYLSRVQANLTDQFLQATETSFAADNASLHEFEAHLGHSYQCKNRSLVLAEGFHLNALNERIQAFGLQGGAFGDAEVCPEQRRSNVLPIVVGVVLVVLIIIVVVAFAVGRWRSHQGYQTL